MVYPIQDGARRRPDLLSSCFHLAACACHKACRVLRRTSRRFSWLAVGFGVVGAALLTAQALRGTLSSFKRRRLR